MPYATTSITDTLQPDISNGQSAKTLLLEVDRSRKNKAFG